ncbi:hypothetical protein [Halosimplex halophilum]|uniref:hypothetical protein n=1 Tax=Halosimplex halophilum TaxID=2559572 RepID=UPI00107FD39D|nr:hypothetical protein [Halosimplex halophilum]
MNRRNAVGTALVVLAAVLFTVPAVFPVQAMLVHDTGSYATGTPEELREEGHEVIAYENLSARGQELYRTTLENDGEYRVPVGEGAPEFSYLNATERRQAFENDNVSAVRAVVIERPEDGGDLPPADEPNFGPRPGENASEEEQRRAETTQRYDAMATATSEPPLGATPQLIRLASVLLAVLSMGVGGYLLSSK